MNLFECSPKFRRNFGEYSLQQLGIPGEHGARLYMELGIPRDVGARHLYGAMNTGRSWS